MGLVTKYPYCYYRCIHNFFFDKYKHKLTQPTSGALILTLTTIVHVKAPDWSNAIETMAVW